MHHTYTCALSPCFVVAQSISSVPAIKTIDGYRSYLGFFGDDLLQNLSSPRLLPHQVKSNQDTKEESGRDKEAGVPEREEHGFHDIAKTCVCWSSLRLSCCLPYGASIISTMAPNSQWFQIPNGSRFPVHLWYHIPQFFLKTMLVIVSAVLANESKPERDCWTRSLLSWWRSERLFP